MFAHVFWATGFRSFFILGAGLATVVVPLWAAMFSGGTLGPHALLGALGWHAHELLLGFVPAILGGFLLTAVRNWTGQPTASGARLAGLVALWAAGRVAVALSWSAPRGGTAALLVAGVDVAFLPALAAAILGPLWRTGNRRNLGFVPLLLGMGILNACWWASALGVMGAEVMNIAMRLAVDGVLIFLVVVGGRIIPLFTANALPNARVARMAWADALAVPSLLLLAVCHALGPDVVAPAFEGICGLAAGVVHAARMSRWGAAKTLRSPILWVLHLGYGWLSVGLLLLGASGLAGWPSRAVATHALTVGALGTLSIGMIARVCLGHTGRPLRVHRLMAVAFAALQAAALLRTAVAAMAPPFYLQTVIWAAAIWCSAFLVFVVLYVPIVISPRPDGKPG